MMHSYFPAIYGSICFLSPCPIGFTWKVEGLFEGSKYINQNNLILGIKTDLWVFKYIWMGTMHIIMWRKTNAHVVTWFMSMLPGLDEIKHMFNTYQLGYVFQTVILDSNIVCSKHVWMYCFVWNRSNAIDAKSVRWLLIIWCFSTRASVATVLMLHSCVSNYLWVNLFSISPVYWICLSIVLTAGGK